MGKRAEQKKETLERLRSVIDELVAQKGYDAVTIREISERAGVSTGVFYYYFKSKDDILLDRFLRAGERFRELASGELSLLTVREALHRIVHYNLQYTLSRVPSVSLSYHKAIMSDYSSWTEHAPDEFRLLLRSLFIRAKENHQLRSSYSPAQLADMLWSMTYGVRIAMLMDGYDFARNTAVKEQLLSWVDAQLIDEA